MESRTYLGIGRVATSQNYCKSEMGYWASSRACDTGGANFGSSVLLAPHRLCFTCSLSGMYDIFESLSPSAELQSDTLGLLTAQGAVRCKGPREDYIDGKTETHRGRVPFLPLLVFFLLPLFSETKCLSHIYIYTHIHIYEPKLHIALWGILED